MSIEHPSSAASGCSTVARAERGFSIIEVMISVGILGIVGAGMAKSCLALQRENYRNDVRTGAISAAQLVLDELRTQDPATFPSSGSSTPRSVTVGSRDFSVLVSYCTIPSLCASVVSRQLRASVTLDGDVKYAVDTVFTQLR